MIKSVFKFSIVFILTALLAVCATSAAYIVTKKIINSSEDLPKEEVSRLDAAAPIDEARPESKVLVPDYYMVKLEGETLGVYASFSEREDFLYNAEVYKTNLSAEDIKLLTKGIRLDSHAALTSFIEDYTS